MPVTTLLSSIFLAWYVSTLVEKLIIYKAKNEKMFSRIFGTRLVDVVSEEINPPPPQQTDEIYPVHFIDQASIVRSSLISYTFRYNHVLDARKLRDSLVILLTTGDWKKLAGRLRQNQEGKLEIHVPLQFTRQRPPIRFSHVKHGMAMDAHPLASRLPKKTGNKPSVHEGCHAFREFSIPSILPNNIKHYLSTDEPLICLHVTSFTDGTIVSFTFPHSLSDAMGTSDLLRAWTRVLYDGNAESLDMDFEGARDDISAQVGDADDKIAKRTRFVLDDQQTTGMSLIAFLGRYGLDSLINRNIETHHIYLPANFMAHLRRKAARELRTVGKENTAQPAPFVSDGDLITAWGSRMVLSSSSSKGTAVICNVFDMRKRLGLLGSSHSRAKAYLQNLILPSTTLLTTEEAGSLGVSQIALKIRDSIVEQTSEDQVRSLMRIARTWFSSLGSMPLFASWDTTRIIACTNWSKARFLDRADFGPAAITTQEKSSVSRAKPVGFWGTTLAVDDNPRDTFVIYGKDQDGDYWVHAYLRRETWQLIKTELDQFA